MGVDTYVPALEVSNIHAAITWQNQEWYIKDLSRNGTWLGDSRLEKLIYTRLILGQKIRFASLDYIWVVDDLTPPQNIVYRVENPEDCLHIGSYTLLPNEEKPECVLSKGKELNDWKFFHAEHGGNENDESKKVATGDIIRFSGVDWKLFLQEEITMTEEVKEKKHPLSEFHFTFKVSLDEEHVEVTARLDSKEFHIKNKTHNYLLLYLARKSLSDFKAGIVESECGWVDNSLLAKELGLDNTHINILIFRIRKNFSKALTIASNPEETIERRSGATRIPIKAKNISIEKGNTVETIHFNQKASSA